MPTTITITLADNSHTAVEHAINHTRAIEREFERVGCTALFEVHTGSLADESVAAERARILTILENMAADAANASVNAFTSEWMNNRAGAHAILQAAIMRI